MDRIAFVPSVWGSSAWKFLHCIALSYPKNPTQQDKSDYRQFFYNLKNVLPCEFCSDNLKQHIKEIPIDNYLNGPHQLFSWTVKMRNFVQKILGKSLYDEESLRESLYTENVKAGRWLDINLKTILLIVLIISSLYLVSRFFKIKITPKK